jgi:hypothetical protein
MLLTVIPRTDWHPSWTAHGEGPFRFTHVEDDGDDYVEERIFIDIGMTSSFRAAVGHIIAFFSPPAYVDPQVGNLDILNEALYEYLDGRSASNLAIYIDARKMADTSTHHEVALLVSTIAGVFNSLPEQSVKATHTIWMSFE